jgi:hypothetical protein
MKLDIPGRTELLGGLVYDVSPKFPPHTHAVRHLVNTLCRGLRDEYEVSSQDPIAVRGWTGKYAPEIDVAVIGRRIYTTTPTEADCFAFVEASDATDKQDRNVYIPLYVAAGVPTWHVNILERRVEFSAKGSAPNDPPTRIFFEGEEFDIIGVSIRVSDLFLPK